MTNMILRRFGGDGNFIGVQYTQAFAMTAMDSRPAPTPNRFGPLELSNRIAPAPMTRVSVRGDRGIE